MKQLAAFLLILFSKTSFVVGQSGTDSIFQKERSKTVPPVEIETVVYLKSRTVLRGKMIEWAEHESLLLRLQNGKEIRIQSEDIDRIKQFRYGGPPRSSDRKKYEFRERGWYNGTCFGLMNPNGYDGKLRESFTFTTTVGFQLSRIGGIGIGIGLDNYGSSGNLKTMPVFLDFRGYFLKNRSTPYFNLMLGHGFALAANDLGNVANTISGLQGGLFFSPNFGFRFGGKRYGNMTLDFGWHVQKGSYVANLFSGGILHDVFYRRYTCRVGILF